jgi:hypothetical protein
VENEPVRINAVLAASLSVVGQALDDPVDLEQLLRNLARDAKTAVPSYLGLSMHVVAARDEFTFTAMEYSVDIAHIRTSLRLPMGTNPTVAAGSTVTFYAGRSGALVDLAADLSWLLFLAPDDIILDRHLAVDGANVVDVLVANSAIQQAIGVLIERGLTAEEASSELLRLARLADTDRLEAAMSVLNSAKGDRGAVSRRADQSP